MEKTIQRALVMVVLVGLLISACESRRRPKEKDPSRKQGGRCSGDLIYMSCGGCQQVCGEPEPKCSRMCHEGCKCPAGLLLRSPGSNVCVKESLCPNANITE